MENSNDNQTTTTNEQPFTIPKRKNISENEMDENVGHKTVLADAYTATNSTYPKNYPIFQSGPLKRPISATNPTQSSYRDSYKDVCDQTLPKDLLMLFQPLYCKLCSAQLSSNIMAKTHYKSKNHDKKVRKYLIEYSERTGEPLHKKATLSNNTQQKLEDTDPKYFHCEVCDLPLTGKIHAESHYMGKNHQKVLAGKKAPTGKGFYDDDGKWIRTIAAKSDPTGRDGFGQDFIIDKSEHTVVDNGLRCELCNVAVTSLPQMEMHLQGQKHLKKLKQGVSDCFEIGESSNIVAALQQNEVLSSYRTPSGQFYCKTCNISLNSEMQFMQHLKSKKHFKKFNVKE